MTKIINFKEKYVEKLAGEIKSAYDAADVISHQEIYKVPIDVQNLFEKYMGGNKSYKEFYDALPKVDEEIKFFVVTSYYLLWNYIYKINDRKDLYEVLEKFNISPEDEWFVLSKDLNRKIFYHLFPIKVLEKENNNQIKLF